MDSKKSGGSLREEDDVHSLPDHGSVVTLELEPDRSAIPIDRGWAWMAVVGCFGVHVFIVGSSKSLGVLMAEIHGRFDGVTAKQISLVQGITTTLMMGLSLTANLLAARFTTRAVVFLGGIMACTGFVLSAFVDRFWLLYITYSLIIGLGFAFSYIPSIVFLGSHFKERRSLANGLSLAGSGTGSFILPNIMRLMLTAYGFPGCCMIMGALMLNVCICGLLFRPHSNYRSKSRSAAVRKDNILVNWSSTLSLSLMNAAANQDVLESHQNSTSKSKEGTKRHPFLKVPENSAVFKRGTQDKTQHDNLCSNAGKMQSLDDTYDSHVANLEHRDNDTQLALLQSSANGSPDELLPEVLSPVNGSLRHNGVRSAQSPRSRKSLFEWSLLTNPVFFLYILFALFVGHAYPTVYFMLPLHAETEGQDRDSSALLLSFLGVSDLIGRLFIGWFSDLQLFERRYAFVVCACISGLLSVFIPMLKSFEGMTFYAIGYGFFAGGYITLLPVVLSDVLGPEKLTSSFGMVGVALSAFLIPAPLLCGQIRDSTGSWQYAYVFVGSLAAFGSLFPLWQPCFLKRQAQTIEKTKASH